MKNMNWPDRVAYLENQLADSDRDNVSLRSRLAEAEARLEEATDLLGFAEARLLAFGQHNSSNPDYVLAMDAIKLFLMTADSADEVHERFCAVYLGVPGECNCKTGPR